MARDDERAAEVVVRYATGFDRGALLAIERASFGASALTIGGLSSLINELSTIGIVAETAAPPKSTRPWKRREPAGEVAGYLAVRISYRSLDVVRVAVAPELRRRGVGRALMDAAKDRTRPHRRTSRIAVPEGALDVQLWLRAIGWRCTAIDGDSYVFETTLDADAATASAKEARC